MAGKYDRLIKPLSIGIRTWEAPAGGQAKPGASVVGPGNAKKEVWLNGREHLEGVGFNISWGVHNTVGDWHAAGKAHTHSYPECLFFVGLDTANVNYLGAEVECCLGSEKEPYTFNEPTVVIVPAGVPTVPFPPNDCSARAASASLPPALARTPILPGLAKPADRAKRRAIAHLVKSLKPGVFVERRKFNAARVMTVERLEKAIEVWQTLKDSGRLPAMVDAKQQKMQKEKDGLKLMGPGHPDHLTWMYGKDLGGVDANIAWGFCSQPGVWQRGMEGHSHQADEVMIFMGIDPNCDELGAEIEIDLGPEHERHLIDKILRHGFPGRPVACAHGHPVGG